MLGPRTVVGVGVGHGESWGQATELVWIWGLLHTLMALASWLEYLDCAPAHLIKVEGKDNKCSRSSPLIWPMCQCL